MLHLTFWKHWTNINSLLWSRELSGSPFARGRQLNYKASFLKCDRHSETEELRMPGHLCHLLMMWFSWGQKWHVSWGRVRLDDFLGLQTMFPLMLWWTIWDDNEKWQRGNMMYQHLLEGLKNWLLEYGVFEATREMSLWEQRTRQNLQKWPPCIKC